MLETGVALFVMALAICPAVLCPLGWRSGRESCYRFTPSPASWNDSRWACWEMGAEMAVPLSPQENELMREMAESAGLQKFWIGCNGLDVKGKWMCEEQEKGEPYLKWRPDELNVNDYQDCAVVLSNSKRGGVVNDRYCTQLIVAMFVRRGLCVDHPGPSTCEYRPALNSFYCFPADTNRQLLNSCLFDHVIREFVTESNPSCTSACIMEPACRSFNIKLSDQGQAFCQLSNATRCDDLDKFQDVNFICNCAQECVD
ncbi:C-type lectin domain family 17, member A-like [Acanthaster planci]|uniref:C-type lectin domain family 17, member A-like n=1 Tax=Acanthaster planci TaxID=133434 RepID=A0A8B7YE11_ACAPL|nr:C-type lectin domain family 17, member A-like [Acanthaster planci]